MGAKLAIKNNNSLLYIKSALMGVMISMIGVLTLTLILRLVMLSDIVVSAVNQVIKAVSIFVAIRHFTRRDTSKILLKSLLIGAIYSVLSYFVFSLLSSEWALGVKTLNDIMFATITAAICAVLINIFKKR